MRIFSGKGGLGGSQLFAYYGAAPKLNWSLLRGFGDPLLEAFALGTWTILTTWLAVDFWGRLSVRDEQGIPHGNSWSVFAWLGSGLFVVLGVWSRSIKDTGGSRWTVPLAMSSVAILFLLLGFWELTRRGQRDGRMTMFLANVLILLAMAGLGVVLPFGKWSEEETFSLGHRLLLSWQDDPTMLTIAFWAWGAATVLLLAGCWTRMAAVLTWALSMSFANANPNIDNAGDTIRGITLFYLMLCPCGRPLWSVDRFIQRRQQAGRMPVPHMSGPGPCDSYSFS